MSQVLIVDDEVTIRYLLRHILEYMGYDVVEANNGLEGLQLCCRMRPDLVLTDLMMPELDGFQLIAHVRREFPPTAIVVISGSTLQDLDRAQQLGAHGTFRKPFDLWTLVKMVDELLLNKIPAAAD